jgi:hypothetical protein
MMGHTISASLANSRIESETGPDSLITIYKVGTVLCTAHVNVDSKYKLSIKYYVIYTLKKKKRAVLLVVD